IQDYKYSGFGSNARYFASNFFGFNNLMAGADIKLGDATSYANGNKLLSFMGRINYSYADKYIATFNMRRDGS
ncbi:hypothetical protein NE451_21650, partial [Bacteroides nordii]|uniref:hypothetical protein n=1 Tax=Bacteroides nordii TaxID=291645 RepID=UPI00210DAB40